MEFSISNEMAVLIGLLGPYGLKLLEPKVESGLSRVKMIFIFRGLRNWKREYRYKRLKELRRVRTISPLVQDLITRSYAYLVLFWLSVFFYLYLIIDSPLKPLFNINVWLTVALAFPIYYAECKWIICSSKKNELLSVMRKRRV